MPHWLLKCLFLGKGKRNRIVIFFYMIFYILLSKEDAITLLVNCRTKFNFTFLSFDFNTFF